MSEQSQGPGWWLASDGRWYPPESRPGQPLPPPPTSSARKQVSMPDRPRSEWAVMAAGVVMVIGAFMPWATAGAFRVNGLDNGGDGWATLILGAFVAWRAWKSSPGGVLMAAVPAAFLSWWHVADMGNRGDDFFEPSVGYGLILTALAASAAIVLGGRWWWDDRQSGG